MLDLNKYDWKLITAFTASTLVSGIIYAYFKNSYQLWTALFIAVFFSFIAYDWIMKSGKLKQDDWIVAIIITIIIVLADIYLFSFIPP